MLEFPMLVVVSHLVMWFGVPVPLMGGGTTAEFGADLAAAPDSWEKARAAVAIRTTNKETQVFMELSVRRLNRQGVVNESFMR
jgi:hypothetical protein